jgi:hypothetical protein
MSVYIGLDSRFRGNDVHRMILESEVGWDGDGCLGVLLKENRGQKTSGMHCCIPDSSFRIC